MCNAVTWVLRCSITRTSTPMTPATSATANQIDIPASVLQKSNTHQIASSSSCPQEGQGMDPGNQTCRNVYFGVFPQELSESVTGRWPTASPSECAATSSPSSGMQKGSRQQWMVERSCRQSATDCAGRRSRMSRQTSSIHGGGKRQHRRLLVRCVERVVQVMLCAERRAGQDRDA